MEIYQNLSIESLPNEEWRDIVGYEGLYQVSNLGRVKSLPRLRNAIHPYVTKEKILKPRWSGDIGKLYLTVALCHNYSFKNYRVHRLVATYFCPNPHNYVEVNHIDENKEHNMSSNLEWCSRAYNVNYGTGNAKRAAKMSEVVQQFTPNGEFVAEYDSFAEAAKAVNGYSANISHVVNGDYATYRGFAWKRKYPIKYLSKTKNSKKDERGNN